MARTIKCNSCGATLNLGESWTHPKAKCAKCNAVVNVPPATEKPKPKPAQDTLQAATAPLTAPMAATTKPVSRKTGVSSGFPAVAGKTLRDTGFLVAQMRCLTAHAHWVEASHHQELHRDQAHLRQVHPDRRVEAHLVRRPECQVRQVRRRRVELRQVQRRRVDVRQVQSRQGSQAR